MNFNNHNLNIEKAIIKIIVFFDLFDYPLAEFELWRYCGIKCGLEDLKSALNNGGVLGGAIESLGGFYFLAGRREIIKTRQERRGYAQRKIKKAARMAKIFKIIPWIKMIAVGNMIGENNLKDESDIDLFIITEPERIWLVRFFCAAIAQLLGQRPKKNKTRDKICLSFFVSEDNLNLKNLMLSEKISKKQKNDNKNALRVTSYALCDYDVYFIYWLAGLRPVYNKIGIYEKFMEANGWIKEYLPNWRGPFCHSRPLRRSFSEASESGNPPAAHRAAGQAGVSRKNLFVPLTHGSRALGMTVINWLEQKAKKLQLELLPANLKKIMNKDTRVVVNDKILKLHSNDRRKEYREKWISNLKVQNSKFKVQNYS